ncbi:DNA gyrase inhibitor YacG [Aliikangiella marina]|uniref:DNA gyrase inhibitor YacG n=1 Tax=Aliikangiella marina TaxID=1712262 RepID=A0A545THY5_9GAMM|nr:DNA gyrase inhibitor YacG [Aliikangiella marina]TQV76815.1 DNA gyrase inhibitor YacG [Aliikangiella marina]
MNEELIISCPTCKKSLRWKDCEEHRPFCSKRCQLIDLGEWANESHSIPGEKVYSEEDNESKY